MMTGRNVFQQYRRLLLAAAVVVVGVLTAAAVSALTKLPVTISRVSPTMFRPASSGTIDLTITGRNFTRRSAVGLSLVAAKRVRFVSATTIVATFDRSKLSARQYDLLVWNDRGGFQGKRKWVTVLPAVDPSVYAVGDIASCDSSADWDTGNYLGSTTGTILTLGDTVYPVGSAANFTQCFDPVWGFLRPRIRPAPGNHDYSTANAAPYFSTFGAAAGDPAKGYYSYTVGQWHLVALNSNCSEVGGCGVGSAQYNWLQTDLQQHPNTCTLAYLHHPPYSSALHGDQPEVQPLWQALVDGGADVLLAGHDHDYERFTVMDRNGQAASRGMREFVVGTGGRSLYPFTSIHATSEARSSSGYGVLRLTLHPTSYDWSFQPVAGNTFTDAGTTTCS
ncbi:MAG: metallophosphoesterase [Candidatus Kerfeldbacteria bacterium]|nr:metallophosphoesterase [Candidatus Kerfeldbacteria bacterium]